MNISSVELQDTKSGASDSDESLLLGSLPVILSGEREADRKVIEAWLSMKGSKSTKVKRREPPRTEANAWAFKPRYDRKIFESISD